MFGISGEHLLILGIVLLIFGPRRLPELGNTLGKAIRNFKDAVSGIEEAKYRHLGDEQASKQQIPPTQAQAHAPAQEAAPAAAQAAQSGPAVQDAEVVATSSTPEKK